MSPTIAAAMASLMICVMRGPSKVESSGNGEFELVTRDEGAGDLLGIGRASHPFPRYRGAARNIAG